MKVEESEMKNLENNHNYGRKQKNNMDDNFEKEKSTKHELYLDTLNLNSVRKKSKSRKNIFNHSNLFHKYRKVNIHHAHEGKKTPRKKKKKKFNRRRKS